MCTASLIVGCWETPRSKRPSRPRQEDDGAGVVLVQQLFDLCTEQSGQFRGKTHLSKRGNARLRYAFWLAGTVAIRMQQNSFRRKFEDYIRPDPKNADRRRKAYSAVAAKVARVAYTMITTGTDYRRFAEATRPSGRIPSPGAVEAATS